LLKTVAKLDPDHFQAARNGTGATAMHSQHDD